MKGNPLPAKQYRPVMGRPGAASAVIIHNPGRNNGGCVPRAPVVPLAHNMAVSAKAVNAWTGYFVPAVRFDMDVQPGCTVT